MASSLEKISILSLSLVLVSAFAITPISHDMYDYYSLPLSAIEILVSLPSLTIMLVLIISPLLTKILSEQTIITTGLIITALSGTFPVLIQSYPLVFASRVLLGIGIGLVNIKAISLIGERYDGEVRQRLFGYRGGVEVFGSAFLTFLAGQLADFEWSYSFLVYSCALIILLLYVFFVPCTIDTGDNAYVTTEDSTEKSTKMSFVQNLYLFSLIGLAMETVLINASIYLRLFDVMSSLGDFTSSQSALLLASQQLIGIVAGILFVFFVKYFRHYCFTFAEVGLCLSLISLVFSPYISSFVVATILTGFFFTIKITLIFNALPELFPKIYLSRVTSLVLLGCSFSAFCVPLVLKFLGSIVGTSRNIFLLYAFLSLLLIIVLFIVEKTKNSTY